MNHLPSKKLFRIDCETVYLQEFSVADAESISQISNQSEVANFLPDWKSSEVQRLNWVTNYEIPANQTFLEAVATASSIDGLIFKLGVFIKERDEFIGWCCTGIKDELPEPNREIMYAISSGHQKKGYATQAAMGLIDYLFSDKDTKTLNGVALTHNVSSNKVLTKCGFIQQSERVIDNERFNHYTLSKTEWLSRLLKNQ